MPKRSKKSRSCSINQSKSNPAIPPNVAAVTPAAETQLDAEMVTQLDAEHSQALSSAENRIEMVKRNQQLFPTSDFLTSDENENILISKNVLRNIISASYCVKCSVLGHVRFDRIDSDTCITVTCPICDAELCSNIPAKVSKEKIVKNTTGIVYTRLNNGTGFAGYQKVTGNLNLPQINSRRYEQYKHVIGKEILKLNEMNKEGVLTCIRQKYAEEGVFPDNDGILNIDVSFDGTWMKRGHTSHFGAAVVIDSPTGFIVDYEVLSNYCHKCVKQKKKVLTDEQKEQHKNECHVNFEGKSGAMEKQQAIIMWQRSEEKYKLRYTTFISDGDSVAYNSVRQMNNNNGPYSVPVIKEECVNHIAKRLGTRLRQIKKTLPNTM